MNRRITDKIDQWMNGPNEKSIIRHIITNEHVSRTDISKALGVSMSTVTNVTDKLLKKELIVEGGLVKAARGRSMKLLEVNRSKFKAIGIGFNYLLLNVSLIDMDGKVYYQEKMPLDTRSWETNYENASVLVGRLLEEYQEYHDDILGIGIETPGFIEYDMRNLDVAYDFEKPWSMETASTYLEERFPYGATSSSSFSGLLCGESYFGSAKNYSHVINVNVSSAGMGWARIQDGQLDRKAAKSFDSLGHMVVNFNGPQCRCSQNGCAEIYTGSKAMLETYKQLARLDPEYAGNHGLDGITYHQLLAMGEAGDPMAAQAITKAASILGTVVANTASILHPDMIILSGRLIRESKLYFEVARNTALKKLSAQGIQSTAIVLPAFNTAGSTSLGVATLVFEQIFLGE